MRIPTPGPQQPAIPALGFAPSCVGGTILLCLGGPKP